MARSKIDPPNPPSELVNFAQYAEGRRSVLSEPPPPPYHGDGTGDGEGQDKMSVGERIARLEGGQTILVGSVAIVSALLLGAMGLLLSMMLDLQSQSRDLAARIDSLPAEINANLLEINRTISEAITASRSNDQPQVIIIDRTEGQSDR